MKSAAFFCDFLSGADMILFQLFYKLFFIVSRMLIMSWPITATLLLILASEWEHAPKKWERHFWLAFSPLVITMLMLGWAAAYVAFPALRFFSLGTFGFGVGQLALCAEIGCGAYALYRLESHRCFFLSVIMLEIWIGFWATMLAGAILGFN